MVLFLGDLCNARW